MENNQNVELYSLFHEAIGEAINNIYSNEIEDSLNLIIRIMEFYGEIKPLISDKPQITDIDAVFNAILQASENKDYILIADLLEFELHALLLQVFNLQNYD